MPTNKLTTPLGMSKPNLIGNQAKLPFNIKPKNVVKKTFKMDLPDEKQSGMYNIKRRVDEDVVESLQDNNDGRSSQMLGSQNRQSQVKTAVKDIQLGP